MEYEIIRKPFMLLETVEMLFKYVNGVDFKDTLSCQRFLAGDNVPDSMYKRMERLQQILISACEGLDPQNPQLQRFFGRADIEFEDVCVAHLMTYSFCTIVSPDLRENAAEICAIWREAQRDGYWLSPDGVNTLMLSSEPGDHGDLFEQVCALAFPPDFQIKLYGALRNFEKSMNELVELIAVSASRLSGLYEQEQWLFDEVECYWREVFAKTTPAKLAGEILGGNSETDAPGKPYVLPLFMKSNFVAFGINQLEDEPYNLLMIGSCATENSRLRRNRDELDAISVILKAIGDRRRLEILHRLSKGRSYCHELSDLMAVDSGNMSRHLTLLHKYGFLRQERTPMVNYYETDKGALRDFLKLVENTVCS